jgi:DASH complex subunit Spc34
VTESVEIYEARVASQTAQLNRMNDKSDLVQDRMEDGVGGTSPKEAAQEVAPVTDEVLRAEEQEIRELEMKKQALEERVASMEKDLGGLLH